MREGESPRRAGGRERRRSGAQRVARPAPAARIFAGVRPLLRALELLAADSERIQTGWRRLLRRLEPGREDFAALEELAKLDLGPAIYDQIGFGPALKLYCRQFAARTGLAVKVQEASPLTSFDAARQPPAGAFGLAAMRGRIEGLGGRLHVESRPARPSGTRIEIDLPLKELAAP